MPPPVGWAKDDLREALRAYARTADVPGEIDPRSFFENRFETGAPIDATFTGYFEMELAGRLNPEKGFTVPLYPMPDSGEPLPDRAAITRGALDIAPIAWVADPLDAFLLQVQGSGRLILPDGHAVGVGYAGRNGHPYRSIGAELVRRGVVTVEDMSLDVIRRYCSENPDAVEELLSTNPSYVFFCLRPAGSGPIGAMGAAVSPLRSIAVDPDFISLGSPVWVDLEIDGKPFRRLMIAQDVGSAIKGPGRIDIFCGTGPDAGEIAGRLNARGKLLPLVSRGGNP